LPKIYKYCVDCESEFFVTEKSQEWLAQQGWELPKRCYDCRQKKKARNDGLVQQAPIVNVDDDFEGDTVVDFWAPTEDSHDGRVRRRRKRKR
jgi:hypothetical protein